MILGLPIPLKKTQFPMKLFTKNGKKKRLLQKEIVIKQIMKQLMTGDRAPQNNMNIITLLDKYIRRQESLKRIFGIE